METALWTLFVGAITGLTWIAYQHPEGFKKNLFFVLWWIPTSVLGGYVLFKFGGMLMSAQFIIEYLADPEKNDSLRRVAEEMARAYLSVLKTIGICSAWLAFVVFLRYLPTIVGKDSKP